MKGFYLLIFKKFEVSFYITDYFNALSQPAMKPYK